MAFLWLLGKRRDNQLSPTSLSYGFLLLNSELHSLNWIAALSYGLNKWTQIQDAVTTGYTPPLSTAMGGLNQHHC